MNDIGTIKHKNILFLQGPMGNFFKKVDDLFAKQGATTYKMGFNMGDSFFSNHTNYIPYRDKPENFSQFIKNFLIKQRIDKIFLFGDCRFYQRTAIKTAIELNVDIFVFEEGYIRPNYITMERYGVNDFSKISRERAFYEKLDLEEVPEAQNVHYSQFQMVSSAVLYYLVSNIFQKRYPHYIHHRDFSAMKEAFFGVRSFIRKLIYPLFEHQYKKIVATELSKKYFFVPLQTHNDFQVLEHSEYKSVEKFIIEILESFAHARTSAWLVFKHHPVDRGRKNYTKFIKEQAKLLNIEKRVLVLYDTHLPTLLKNAIGTVTINSTVGLSSLYHNTPTITLGNAIYDIEGLTCKGMRLDDFWHKQDSPDTELLQKYKKFLIENTQLNGSFYGKLPKEFQVLKPQ
ncbi:capsular biosynthesis protein [Sulfurimonas sediminis]|uniref:Capsular biosynthesis protein n=1 Tax=Sulfurimonas sediminis TaxID=2590020 RepID=A0A7M1B1Z3_9BACT|nr:capsular biosynthesis protein [Sulfurimonas sediminis]QOP42682.1 capsular biosynthesis protein [Sulfurimonas sediminis]